MADLRKQADMANLTAPAVARIYALIDPRDLEVRYVGMTTQSLTMRLRGHCRDFRGQDNYRARWIRVLRREGVKPIIVELETVPVADWGDAEKKWIAFYRRSGARLVNATDGGEGTLGRKRPIAERKRLSEAGRLRFQDPRAREAVGLVHRGKTISEQHKRAVGEAATRKWAEYRASGGTLSPESRARLSAAAKARKPHEWTAESRAKLAESKRKSWAERKAVGDDIAIRQRMREGIARSAKRSLTGLGTVVVDADGTVHGMTGYNYGCRCEVCRSAKTAKGKLRTAKEREARLTTPRPPRFCADCTADISHRHLNAKYCEGCGSDAKVQARMRRRRKSIA